MLGNRLDRFKWDGTTLTFEKTLHRGCARSRTRRRASRVRGNHNGGVVRVGPDGKIYLIVGDTGRRGQTQNLVDGPFVYPLPTTRRRRHRRRPVRRPGPRRRHLTGVILRLNTDGTAPKDNPFYKEGAERGGRSARA